MCNDDEMMKACLAEKLWIDDYIVKQASYLNEQKQAISAAAPAAAASASASSTRL